jgi:hypothetical protein
VEVEGNIKTAVEDRLIKMAKAIFIVLRGNLNIFAQTRIFNMV